MSLSDDAIELFAAEIAPNPPVARRWTGEEKRDSRPSTSRTTRRGRASCAPRQPVITVMGHATTAKTPATYKIRGPKSSPSRPRHPQHRRLPSRTDGRLIHVHRHPGHEAFTAMRARGAQSPTSCARVAADDGVMPQQSSHQPRQGGRLPIVVAVTRSTARTPTLSACSSSYRHGLTPRRGRAHDHRRGVGAPGSRCRRSARAAPARRRSRGAEGPILTVGREALCSRPLDVGARPGSPSSSRTERCARRSDRGRCRVGPGTRVWDDKATTSNRLCRRCPCRCSVSPRGYRSPATVPGHRRRQDGAHHR